MHIYLCVYYFPWLKGLLNNLNLELLTQNHFYVSAYDGSRHALSISHGATWSHRHHWKCCIWELGVSRENSSETAVPLHEFIRNKTFQTAQQLVQPTAWQLALSWASNPQRWQSRRFEACGSPRRWTQILCFDRFDLGPVFLSQTGLWA